MRSKRLNHLSLALFVSVCALAGTGCGSSGRREESPKRAAVPIPASSPFSKIKIGMKMGEVNALIGNPTDTKAYATGKAFIPFHFGGDNARTESLYKGMGTIIFSQRSAFGGGFSVIEIIYDPQEKGYR